MQEERACFPPQTYASFTFLNVSPPAGAEIRVPFDWKRIAVIDPSTVFHEKINLTCLSGLCTNEWREQKKTKKTVNIFFNIALFILHFNQYILK